MESRLAKVVAVGRERVTVSVAAAACPRCAAGRGCGAGLLGPRPPTELPVKAAPGVALKPGDSVRLELVPARLLRAAWLAYGLPLAGLVGGALLAAYLVPGAEPMAVLASAGGLVTGALLGRRALSSKGQLSECVPTAAERIG